MSTAATTNTITTTTAYRNVKAELTAKDETATEKEMDQVLVQPVEAAYPNLVSNNTKWIYKITRTLQVEFSN